MRNISFRTMVPIVAGILIIGMVSFLGFWTLTNRFKEHMFMELESGREELIEDQKQEIKIAIDMAYDVLKSFIDEEEQRAKQITKSYTDVLLEVLMRIYELEKNKVPEDELKKKLLEVISNVRYSPSGYFFVFDTKGIMLTHPDPSLSGKSIETFDPRARYIAKRIIKTAIEQGSGFIKYKWKKLNGSDEEEKLTYCVFLRNFRWIIATGVYISDLRRTLQKEAQMLLARLSDLAKLNFFVISSDKRFIFESTKILDLGNSQLEKIIKDSKKKGSAFIEARCSETDRAIIYTRYNPDWDIVIGAGFCLKKIDNLMIQKRSNLSNSITKLIKRALIGEILLILSAVIVVPLLTYLIAVKPIVDDLHKIIEGMRKLLEHRISTTEPSAVSEAEIPVKREDELGVLVDLINKVVEKTLFLRYFKSIIEEDPNAERIYKRISEVLKNRLGLQNHLIFELSDDGKKARLVVAPKRELEKYMCANLRYKPDKCRVKRTGKIAYGIGDVRSCERHYIEEYQVVCIPIVSGGRTLGIVKLLFDPNESPDKIRELSEEANFFIEETAPVIEAKRYAESLQEMSLRDPLTKVYNRRFLQEHIEHIIYGVRRRGTCIGILMLDIDHFKNINDQYGHMAGDKILIHLVEMIKKNIRRSDIIVRFGGEEFLIMLIDTKPGESVRVAEKIRKSIEKEPIKIEEREINITVTIGVSEFPTDSEDLNETIRYADTALYLGKEAGRNRVVRFNGEKT